MGTESIPRTLCGREDLVNVLSEPEIIDKLHGHGYIKQ